MEKPNKEKHLGPNDAAKPVASTSAKAKIAPVEKGTLVKRKGAHDENPTIENHKVRPHVKNTGGARYGINVKFQKTEAPEAGATLANARLLPSAIKRSAQTFVAGMADQD